MKSKLQILYFQLTQINIFCGQFFVYDGPGRERGCTDQKITEGIEVEYNIERLCTFSAHYAAAMLIISEKLEYYSTTFFRLTHQVVKITVPYI